MSPLNYSFDEKIFNFDIYFENYTPMISLDETDKINNTYPFTQPEPKTVKENGKERLELFKVIKKNRKEKEDNIRKKIKTFFHKSLRKAINTKLEKAGSKFLFESFPQIFITDITIKTNVEALELTFEQLFDYSYNQEIKEDKSYQGKEYIQKRKATADKKYKKNIDALEYLNSNRKISEESGWEIIKNMKYIDLLRAYFNSLEFQQNVKELSKKETDDYINSYIYFASTYVDFFLRYQQNEKKNKKKVISHPYRPIEKVINQNEASNLNYNPDVNKITIDEFMPSTSTFQPSIFKMSKDDCYSPDSLSFSKNDEYDSTNGNSFFNKGILF